MINGTEFSLEVKKYPKEGFLQHTYSPLMNLKNSDNRIGDFTIPADKLNIKLKNIIIDCQPSYDGTVNLILNDDVNVPRLINTRFSKKENDTFKVINRNQSQQTNIYEIDNLDQQTRLIKNSRFFPTIDLLDVSNSGCLLGGNYTLYLKYLDGDYNESPIMCESGQISIFHGTNPSGISGTLSDELTTKAIRILINNLDTSYNLFKLYFVRNYSDISGTRMSDAYVFTKEFSFSETTKELMITGYEEYDKIPIEELNIQYQTVDGVKTQTQVQNMLFFGNINKTSSSDTLLQQLSYYITVSLKQGDSIGYVNHEYEFDVDSEYYNPENIYYKLGYWPGEYYRLGVVYIMNDDSCTPVFNLRGCVFNSVWDTSKSDGVNYDSSSNMRYYDSAPIVYDKKNILESNTYLTNDIRKINTFGVFKNPSETETTSVINKDGVKPYYYEISISDEITKILKENNVKGYFFVRQKRIPTIFGQGVAFGIDKTSFAPMIPINNEYQTEGFLYLNDEQKVRLKKDNTFVKSVMSTNIAQKQSSCLISVDADTSPSLQSMLSGSEFTFEEARRGYISRTNRMYSHNLTSDTPDGFWYNNAIYVTEDTPYKFINEYGFSTRFGSAEEIKSVSFFGKPITNTSLDETTNVTVGGETPEDSEVLKSNTVYGGKNTNLLRGVYTGIIGIMGNVRDGSLYNIRIPEYIDDKTEEYFNIRKNDLSSYYAISNRYSVNDGGNTIGVYRGDCYTNTVTVRLMRNFIDPDAPIMDTIVNDKTWAENYTGFLRMKASSDPDAATNEDNPSGTWSLINKADINAVPIGTWFTYKCLSSNNLGLRAIDRSYVDEQALLGNPRGFYPISGLNTYSSGKISDSKILNLGYSATVGELHYLGYKNLPYQKELFDNRIMFSNVQAEDQFSNGYRVFQNLAYKDIDRQYGAIVKLLPWNTDLLCVFEHGIGIIPVNQKALIQTTTGQSVHMYGAGVLQSQITLIDGDFGSTWQESIIETPIGVYGVDTFAKKIWRYSKQKGFETISDMTVQRFLNDNILLSEHSNTLLGILNVKSHYNNYKGDVLFTFYNKFKNCEWHLCYNERLGKWTTRYSWIPLYSENINNIFYSFDKRRGEVLSQIHQIKGDEYGIKIMQSPIYNNAGVYEYELQLSGQDLKNAIFSTFIDSVHTSYLDERGQEIKITFDEHSFINIDSDNKTSNKMSLNVDLLKNKWTELFSISENKYYYEWVPLERDVDNSDIETLEQFVLSDIPISKVASDFNLKESDLKIGNYVLDGKTISIWYCKVQEEEVISSVSNPTELPFYLWINVTTYSFYGDDAENQATGIPRTYIIPFIINSKDLNTSDKKMYDEMFINGVYVHGRAGIFDEIDYTDNDLNNQILPTKWYGKQEPFEFEFVINDPIGMHKIFENLTIVSNNVQPESIQFEIEGDSYSMWKAMNNGSVNPTYSKQLKQNQYYKNTLFKNASIKWDTILNQYSILMNQNCKSIEKFGRRLGNTHYKEDSWYITIDPLLLNKNGKMTSTKLRDKYLKVRIRYTGDELAVITAIKSMVNLSAS